ncbi:hypothetical protein CHU98_g7691 [Xylaria longipes]|nr:hypothetical protein CHU98_g7691 [Xylaria longipes]
MTKLTSVIMHHTNPDNTIRIETEEVLHQALRVEPAPAEPDVVFVSTAATTSRDAHPATRKLTVETRAADEPVASP